VHRMGVGVAAVVAVLAVAVGGGRAGADPAEFGTSTVTGWVVDNPRADGLYETREGSVTIVGVAGGGTISCALVDGWGWADSGTLRPNDFFGGTGGTTYGGCTGPGGTDLEVWSSPDMVFVPETYDAEADRLSGSAYPLTWGLFLDSPDCQVSLYPLDSNAPAPHSYDNRTATLDAGPVTVVAARADGTGCGALGEVGDELTFETTFVATPGFTVRPA
jgi:hypothetical protein